MHPIDPAATAWLLASTALVLLMTPGLAIFYGGMVRTTGVLNMIMMSFISIPLVTVAWLLLGYTIAFSEDGASGFLGNLGHVGMLGITPDTAHGAVPELLYATFQVTFAIITAALVSGAIDGSMLIAPLSFYAKDKGFKELVAFQDAGFVLPSGGIVARDETLKNDPLMAEKFVRATIMGFLYMRDNRAGTLKVMARVLKIDERTAEKLYDTSRPTLTRDGTVAGDAQKKMTAMVLKIAGAKEAPAADELYDFSLVKKAHVALQAKGWRALP